MSKAERFIRWVHLNDIKVIAFAFNNTLINRDLHNVILHTSFQYYVDNCSEDFKSIIFDLLEEKELHIAVVAYMDNEYHLEYDKEIYISGLDLVNKLLCAIGLNDEQLKKVVKLFRSPKLHNEKFEGKSWHLGKLKTMFNVSPEEILLFEHSSYNISFSGQYRNIKVSEKGFSLNDIPLGDKLTDDDWDRIPGI